MKRIPFLFLLLSVALLLFAACKKEASTACTDGHTPGAWTVILEATETQEGLRHRLCEVCKQTLESERIPKLTAAEMPESRPPQSDGGNTEPPTADAQDKPSLLVFEALPDGTLAVRAASNTMTACTVPETHEGKTVTQILPRGFAGCAQLQHLTLPTTLTRVGNAAFDGCTSLVCEQRFGGVYLGNVLLAPSSSSALFLQPADGTLLSDDAFREAPSLAYLVLPATLCGAGQALAALTPGTAVFTEMSAADWARFPGSDALPQNVPLYTAGDWTYVSGLPAPIAEKNAPAANG